jgi:hypothetical protein
MTEINVEIRTLRTTFVGAFPGYTMFDRIMIAYQIFVNDASYRSLHCYQEDGGGILCFSWIPFSPDSHYRHPVHTPVRSDQHVRKAYRFSS